MCGRSLETIFGIVVVFKKTVLIMVLGICTKVCWLHPGLLLRPLPPSVLSSWAGGQLECLAKHHPERL